MMMITHTHTQAHYARVANTTLEIDFNFYNIDLNWGGERTNGISPPDEEYRMISARALAQISRIAREICARWNPACAASVRARCVYVRLLLAQLS